jgi:Tfp pilus assembly protein PilF
MPAPKPFLTAVALFTLALPAFAADEWIRLSTPHVELYTTTGDKGAAEKRAREAIRTFEQTRAILLEAAHAHWGQVIPVRIISFQSDKQFKPYAPDGAYSSNTQSRDYFIMIDSDPDHLPAAIHQYVDLALQRAGLSLPTWFSEGLAEMFSTLKPSAGDAATGAPTGAMLGGVLKDHVDELKSVKWLDFTTLTSVNEHSPGYNEKNRAGLFYAESWALVHMLCFGRDYHENIAKLIGALNNGKTTGDAFQTAYGRTTAQVNMDLQAYVKQNSLTAASFPIKGPAAQDPVASPVSDLESGVMLADLMATLNKREQAKASYDKLAKQYPGSADISESLGYLAMQSGDNESARKYFEEALPGTKNPLMCYHLAMLYHDAAQGGDKLVAALTRAVALKPDYAEARLQLGVLKYSQGDFAGAIATLAPIEHIAPEHAATLHSVLTEAYAQAGVQDLPGGLKRAEGQAVALECDGAHQRLSVLVGKNTMTFEIADPKRIALRHEFVCGPMNQIHVTVDYQPDGVLKAIEF